MRYLLLCGAAVLGLGACSSPIPDSGAGVVDRGQGVGFGSYDDYAAQQRAARDAQLEGRAPQTAVLPPAPPGSVETQALRNAAAANSGVAPVDASPGNPAPQVVSNAQGISGENDFDAVSQQRDIEDDAALLAQNRAQYQLITPTSLPVRAGTNTPNIVQYALQTNNPVGTALYRRSSFRAAAKFQQSCAPFATADLAQEAFLAAGGPEQDKSGMDPDGDGFACTWDPSPYRAVRGG